MWLLEILEAEVDNVPKAYGWYHLLMFGLSILATVLLCIFYKDATDKKFRKIILISWIIFLILELYKQLTLSTTWEGFRGATETSYNVYYFPFQFCSTPFYVLPLIAFLPDGKIRNALMSFTSTFILFAGIAVMCTPDSVFCDRIGINIQTMVHHGMQIALGAYITVYNRKKYLESLKDLLVYCLTGVCVFAVFALIAIVLNELLANEGVNFFFISRHVDCSLPILSSIYLSAPYIVFLLCYLIGFVVVAVIFIIIERLLIKLICKK